MLDWNPNDPFLVSGGDDGMVKVWDLRNFGGQCDPVAKFKHHTGPVTSVEWHRDDSTVFASSGEDHQVRGGDPDILSCVMMYIVCHYFRWRSGTWPSSVTRRREKVVTTS